MLMHEEVQGHKPVLLSEVLSVFPDDWKGSDFLDCTFGRGGHCLALLEKYPNLKILALDRDSQAIEHGKSLKESRLDFLKINFHDFPLEHSDKSFDAVLMDLGVSSPQIDQAERGFSFDKNGPLDMRMDRDQRLTAADVVNGFSKQQLIDLFIDYGEIKNPYKVVDAIFTQRKKEKFKTTRQLTEVILKHSPKRWNRHHPATLYFLAIRMFVNQELEGLEKNLSSFLNVLNSNAYFIIITFHSLEDRIVKRAFKQFAAEGKGEIFNKKVIRAGMEERKKNPRSRSAKMRVFVKS